jgi:thiol-disulfide isomerase/thioredoxin
MLPEIGRWQEEHSDKLAVSLVSRGTPEENRTKMGEHGLAHVLLQKDWEISEAYQVAGTPSALLVSPDGTIGSPVVGGAEAKKALVAQAMGERSQLPLHQPTVQGEPCPNCGKVHAPAPYMPVSVRLADLKGEEVSLQEDFKGEDTLVLFWNPGCGFCQQMFPDLKDWETISPEDAPRLVVVSAGSEEANEEMDLTSPVLLDQQFAVGRAFGASGTPSAVLVDAEGKVASDVAVGARAVLELAGAEQT